jgi:hypothetical protein
VKPHLEDGKIPIFSTNRRQFGGRAVQGLLSRRHEPREEPSHHIWSTFLVGLQFLRRSAGPVLLQLCPFTSTSILNWFDKKVCLENLWKLDSFIRNTLVTKLNKHDVCMNYSERRPANAPSLQVMKSKTVSATLKTGRYHLSDWM